jgi:ribonuclease VapC
MSPPARIMPSHVLDASALLALVFREPGADVVISAGGDLCCSAVNLSETLAKLSDRGIDSDTAERNIDNLVRTVIPFTTELAKAAAALRPLTRFTNTSFADRACIATGMVLELPILTADAAWAELGLHADIRMIR